ncbi:hypothetical protein BT96DRAFT_653771 [Gymnopus androsaceus JB14]|uniref:Uncharacterized protein n=1 Tax=Gymnopus androsaceus JB14 TaxID=1447944 RepID=A0A6A4GGD4_9AGAR|nr:hypothetical protein BT96DRAFT_653771 [Gymnopus androsaceus JB14]
MKGMELGLLAILLVLVRTHPDVPIIPISGTRPLPSEPGGRSSPSIISAVPPPGRTRTPRSPVFGDLALAEEERDRLARLDEVEHRLNDVAKGVREAEQQREAEFQDKERLREDEFRSNEEDRQRIFRENEEARAREAAEARDAMLQDFPEGLGTATGMDPRTQVTGSWATWQPDPNLAPTTASVEPTLLVPDRGSPGLFGPRSPPEKGPRMPLYPVPAFYMPVRDGGRERYRVVVVALRICARLSPSSTNHSNGDADLG